MSARSVWSGTRPSRYHSRRAISAPPRRPEHWTRIPWAPAFMAVCTARFMARRNDAGTGRVHVDPEAVTCPLDLHAADRRPAELGVEVLADLDVFGEVVGVLAVREPARLPVGDDPEAE